MVGATSSEGFLVQNILDLATSWAKRRTTACEYSHTQKRLNQFAIFAIHQRRDAMHPEHILLNLVSSTLNTK